MSDTFYRGKGYFYQGSWLGTDPAAFNTVEIRADDVSVIEESAGFTRFILRTGQIVIMLTVAKVEPLALPPGTAVIDATPKLPALPKGKARLLKKGS